MCANLNCLLHVTQCFLMKVIFFGQVHVTWPSSERAGEQIASKLCCWFVVIKRDVCIFFLYLFPGFFITSYFYTT